MLTVKLKVLSVKPMTFTDKETNKPKSLWQVFAATDDGAVGSVYADTAYKVGDELVLTIGVNRDGRFTAKVLK